MGRGERPEIPPKELSYVPAEWWQLVKACWAQAPAERPSCDMIIRKLKSIHNNIAGNFHAFSHPHFFNCWFAPRI